MLEQLEFRGAPSDMAGNMPAFALAAALPTPAVVMANGWAAGAAPMTVALSNGGDSVPTVGLMAIGIDQIYSGGASIVTGERSPSVVEFLGSSAASGLGASDQTAQVVGTFTPAALSLVFTLGGGLLAGSTAAGEATLGGAMSGGYRGVGMTQAEVDAATAEFRAAGGVVDQSLGAQRYLQMRGAAGLTFDANTILLPLNPTRTAVFEELVHAGQFGRGVIIQAGGGGVLRFEAEAAETLIQNRLLWQLPSGEVRQVIDNLRNIRAALLRLGVGQ